jgi:PAS domain S-box-containing protein
MRILIIEDNQGIAELISEKLIENGYDTKIAYTGKQAIDYLTATSPDIIILDYSLPDMDGKELVNILKEKSITMPPFIVSTGRGDEQVAVDMMKLGAYDYLIKDPYLINRLPDVVVKLQNEIKTLNRLKEAEKALKASEERFRSFVENSSDLFVKVSQDGEYVYVSPNSRNLLGYETSELLGKVFSDFILPESMPAVLKEFEGIVKSENLSGAVEYQIRHKDGDIRYHTVRGYSVKEGDKIYINCIARDVTEKRLAENRLLNAIVETEENERKRFAEELHEGLGPLLSSLKLYMDRLKDVQGLPEKEMSSVLLCDQFVDDSVKQVRIIANKLMPTILNDFGLMKAVSSLVSKINDSGSVPINFKADTVMPHLPHLTEVILYRGIEELINNTLKHANAQNININMQVDSNNVLELKFTDDGIGFNDSDVFSVNNKDAMGLKKLQSRINSLGGSMEIISKPGKGAVVKIRVKVV